MLLSSFDCACLGIFPYSPFSNASNCLIQSNVVLIIAPWGDSRPTSYRERTCKPSRTIARHWLNQTMLPTATLAGSDSAFHLCNVRAPFLGYATGVARRSSQPGSGEDRPSSRRRIGNATYIPLQTSLAPQIVCWGAIGGSRDDGDRAGRIRQSSALPDPAIR